MAEGKNQREYWNNNLDAANLGRGQSESVESLQEEILFSAVPDIDDMLAEMASAPGKMILEIGAGLGGNAFRVSQLGANVVALDLSHERLALVPDRLGDMGSANRGKIFRVQAKAEALPFRDGALDGAFCRAVLIHTQLEQTCTEIGRALKADAPVAFSEPMAHNPFVKIYRLFFAPKEWRGITTYFTRPEIELVESHFDECRTRYYYGISFLAFVFQYALKAPIWFYATLTRLESVDKFIAARWTGYRKYSWFVLMTGRTRRG